MEHKSILISILLLCFVYISNSSRLFVREDIPVGWQKLSRAPQDSVIKFRIALRQHNLHILESLVLAKSDPTSPSYGKHLKSEEILELVSPPESETLPVLDWLSLNGATNVDWMGDVIKAEARVNQIEEMFQTDMFVYQHIQGQRRILNFGSAHIPDHLKHIIVLVSGLTEFPYFKQLKMREMEEMIGEIEENDGESGSNNSTDPGYIVPATLQTLYNIPSKFKVHSNSSLCLAEFQGDTSFNQTDLDVFAKEMNVPPFPTIKMVGPENERSPDAESTLDVQYGGAIALNTNLWFWTVNGWMYEFATDLFNTQNAPLVVSMSWGWPEPWQCQSGVGNCTSRGWTSIEYVNRVNNEFMKIVARGITLVAASGDLGAPGDMNPYCEETKEDEILSNLFPASSPWVTAVGATMLNATKNKISYSLPPVCTKDNMTCATNGSEIVCSIREALITSGGGFSSYSPRPSWQSESVDQYLSSDVILPDKKYFNSSNRAFPDISALGHNYIIQWNGFPMQVDGTSCSSPVVAGMIALLNSERLNNKKTPLGFINPMLYHAAMNGTGIFNDLTSGHNKCTENCCSKYGFMATKGWDPVTGLGTPNFPALLKYVSDLP